MSARGVCISRAGKTAALLSCRFFGGFMNDALCVVLSTAPNRETAERIGEALLSEHLAACVQYEAIRSQY